MGCHQSKSNLPVDKLHVTVDSQSSISSSLGGRISLYCDDTITCDWKNGGNAALLQLSSDRMIATNVPPGKYEITCASKTKLPVTLLVVIEQLKIPRVDSYEVTHATNDAARDGRIKANICDLEQQVRYLWTSGVVTEEPELHDVPPGTYTINMLTMDKLPPLFYHACHPAVVESRG